jgi:UPF0271 protein
VDLGSLPPQLRLIFRALEKAFASREPAIRSHVQEVRDQNPGATSDELSEILIRQARRRVAGSAAVSGATAIVPGVGTILAIGTSAGQGIYALEQEVELVLGIAMVYDHQLHESDQRLLEALVVVGLAGGAVRLRDEVLVAGGERITVAAFRRFPGRWLARAGGGVISRIMQRIFRTEAVAGAFTIIPLAVGVVAGAGFDWITVTALGRAAQRYYRSTPPAPPLPGGADDGAEVEGGG